MVNGKLIYRFSTVVSMSLRSLPSADQYGSASGIFSFSSYQVFAFNSKSFSHISYLSFYLWVTIYLVSFWILPWKTKADSLEIDKQCIARTVTSIYWEQPRAYRELNLMQYRFLTVSNVHNSYGHESMIWSSQEDKWEWMAYSWNKASSRTGCWDSRKDHGQNS